VAEPQAEKGGYQGSGKAKGEGWIVTMGLDGVPDT
jgi:hypothetical protein